LFHETNVLRKESMMRKANQHVVPTPDGRWGVRGEGNDRLTKVVDTQGEAIEVAKPIAQHRGGEVVIHRRDGTIRDKDSYGNDPSDIRDRKH
jgi:uncharacterized protein YdaT